MQGNRKDLQTIVEEDNTKVEFILLAQFNEIQGKLIIGKYPEVISNKLIQPQDLFDRYSDFLIPPRDQLCGQYLAISIHNKYYLLSIPVVLKNKQKDQTYKRAKYFFGITLCVEKEKYEKNKLNYQQMIRKVTYFFVILEVLIKDIQIEKHALYNFKQRECKAILRNTYLQLNKAQQTIMNYKGKYFTYISTCTSRFTDKIAKPYQVPLTVLSILDIESINHDRLKRIMRQVVYGQSCVKKISQELDIRLDQVLQYLNIGIKYGIIYMLDIFGTENVYALTKEIHDFAKNPSRINRLKSSIISHSPPTHLPQVTSQQILQMYLKLRRGKSIKTHFEKYPEFFAKVSVVTFIRMGIIEGIVKRTKEILTFKQIPPSYSKQINFINNEIYEQSFQFIKMKQQALYASLITASIQRINSSLNKFVLQNAEVQQVMVQFYITRSKLWEIVSPHGIQFLQVD